MEAIRLRFAEKIIQEEWSDFEKRHRNVIKSRTTRRTGNLEDNRKYFVKREGSTGVKAGFEHPIYERFLDMRKNYMGDWGTRPGRVRKDLMVRKRGIKIHNRIIFGKLGPISFRLMHELSDQVREHVRKHFKQKQ